MASNFMSLVHWLAIQTIKEIFHNLVIKLAEESNVANVVVVISPPFPIERNMPNYEVVVDLPKPTRSKPDWNKFGF